MNFRPDTARSEYVLTRALGSGANVQMSGLAEVLQNMERLENQERSFLKPLFFTPKTSI
jgi:hypothetical protein